jgi:uncharacterized protein (TIGR00369 family)
MRRINPEYLEAVRTRTNQCPYFQLQSMKLVEFEVGSSLLEIDVRNKHHQPFGIVHGGVFSTIIDAAVFWSVYSALQENVGLTTVDLKINFLAPVISGKLIAKGRLIKLGKTLGLGEAEVTNGDGKMVAHGTSTLIVLPSLAFPEQHLLPPKFLDGMAPSESSRPTRKRRLPLRNSE